MQRIWISQNFRSHFRSEVLIELLTLQSSNKIIVFPYRGHRQGRPREDTNTEHLLKCYEPGPSRDAQRKHTSYVFVRKFCPGWYDSATPRERVRGFPGFSYISFGRFTQTWRHHYMFSIHLQNWKQWCRINNWGEIAFFWEELSSHLITQFNQLYIIDLKSGAGDKRPYLLSPTYFRMLGHAPWPLFSHYWLEGIEQWFSTFSGKFPPLSIANLSPPPPQPASSGGWRPGYFSGVGHHVHQEPNFEGNFEIRCAGNACISIFVRSMNASEPKMLSFIGPVSILVWVLCPVVMRYCPQVVM